MGKDDLTYKIIGCAIKVHNTMGSGFQEVIYQRCLAIELGRAGLDFPPRYHANFSHRR
jgi:GxxExxY protein